MTMPTALCAIACLIATAMLSAAPKRDAAGFLDHGIGAPVIESRGVVATTDDNGRNVVIAHADGFVLVTDIDTQETVQISTPPGVPTGGMYGSILATNNRHYMGHGNYICEFDPTSREWTFAEVGASNEEAYIGITEGPDGRIWAGGYPHASLVSFDPKTRELKNYGQMDPTEAYLSYMAVADDGWVYMGIGTARRSIVGYNPATGEHHQYVPEERRTTGGGYVHLGIDGKVYGNDGTDWYSFDKGHATVIDQADAAAKRPSGYIYWPNVTFTLPDGRRVIDYSMPDRFMKIQNPDTLEVTTITFDYTCDGATLSSVGTGPNGAVYAASGHPMHWVNVDPATGKLTDWGAVPKIGGGHINCFAHDDRYAYGGSYSSGYLWAYDTTIPWNPSPQQIKFGLSPAQLASIGKIPGGEVRYLEGNDLCFLKSPNFGVVADFPLKAREDCDYYLYVLPYDNTSYCTVKFAIDGQQIGKAYNANADEAGVGTMQIFGPLTLGAGEHTFSVRLTHLNKAPHPWFSLAGVLLTQTRIAELDVAAAATPLNPRILAEWHDDIGRPREVLPLPDGHTILMSGFPGYGRTGGGIGIYNMATDEASVLTANDDLLPGLTTMDMVSLDDNTIVCATSALAITGAHRTAGDAELFMLSWPDKTIDFHFVPVAGADSINAITLGANGLIYGITDSRWLFVFDPITRKLVHSEDLSEYGGVPRHAILTGPDGNIYLLMTQGILRIAESTFSHEMLGVPPAGIGVGGALVDGILYYAAGSNVWSFDIPGL